MFGVTSIVLIRGFGTTPAMRGRSRLDATRTCDGSRTRNSAQPVRRQCVTLSWNEQAISYTYPRVPLGNETGSAKVCNNELKPISAGLPFAGTMLVVTGAGRAQGCRWEGNGAVRVHMLACARTCVGGRMFGAGGATAGRRCPSASQGRRSRR